MDASTRTTFSEIVLSLLAIILLAGCGGNTTDTTGSATALSRSAPPPVATAAVMYCADDCAQTADTFSLSSVRDITVSVSWNNVLGSHVQQLRFLSPSGDEYQRVDTRFDTATVGLHQGIPTVQNVLPVAGTWIQQRSTTGSWSVEVFLDDKFVTSSTLVLR